MKVLHATTEVRRGVLLLLVLSALTMFMMLGALMLVLATRARTAARAFASASTSVSREDLRARSALDEALMMLLRGPAIAGGPVTESILADRYGSVVTTGSVTNCTFASGSATATITGINAATPMQFNGRVLTIRPPASDPAPVQSYRIVNFSGGVATLANLRGAQPFQRRPSTFPCTAIINGRDFDSSAGNEPWDDADAANSFLTSGTLSGSEFSLTRPAFGSAGPGQVDNDGDGVAEGVWLAGVLPARPQESGTLTFRVSYTVLDMDGRVNVNAHGLPPNVSAAVGPASVDVAAVLGQSVWTRLMNGGTIPAATPPSAQQRRPAPALGYDVDGRVGRLGNGVGPYDMRLDFDGPRPGSTSLDGERVAVGVIGSLFTAGELERIMRAFDTDAAVLPPRLAGSLGDDAQRARMLVTTDSWDTTALVGQAASAVMGQSGTNSLPMEVQQGRRFDINTGTVGTEADKRVFFHRLLAVSLAAGAPNDTATVQWAANVAEFRDQSSDTTTYTTNADYAGIAIPTPITVTGHEATEYGGLGGNTPNERFTSIGQLLCVPRGSQQQLANPFCPVELRRSLAVDNPVILDAVTVGSPFVATVAANPWREPGRVNVNTCEPTVWSAMLGESTPPTNPFLASPAQSAGGMLTTDQLVFLNSTRRYTAVNTGRASRLANIATTRSNVFAVWITVETTDSAAVDQARSYRRLFAIVDRSIPVGFLPGVNLNARDTLRLVRYLE